MFFKACIFLSELYNKLNVVTIFKNVGQHNHFKLILEDYKVGVLKLFLGKVYVLIQNILGKQGFKLTRKQAMQGERFNLLPVLAKYLLEQGHTGTVIQVGANDGQLVDPIYPLLNECEQLSALLIEPLPTAFKKLQQTYSKLESRVTLANIAIGDSSGELTLYYVDDEYIKENSCVNLSGLASVNYSVILKAAKHNKNLHKAIRSSKVESLSFNQVLSKYNIGEVFMLQIDTEGYDSVVLHQALDAGLKPPIIQYEHKHLSLRDQEKCRNSLINKGYQFVGHDEEDTLAIKLM